MTVSDAEKSANTAIRTCEDMELEGTATSETQTLLMAAYLLKGDLNNARFLYKRATADLTQPSTEFSALFTVCKVMWARGSVNPALTAYTWSSKVNEFVAILKDVSSEKALSLLARSYSVVNAEHVATVLGVSAADAVAVAVGRGWQHAADTNTLTPPPAAASSSTKEQVQLEDLADIIVHLEQ